MGIEPTCSAWKADVLPLNYTRQILHHPFAINIQLTDLLRNIHFHRIWHFKIPLRQKPTILTAIHYKIHFGGGGRIRTYEG